jgi:hypothetical protein
MQATLSNKGPRMSESGKNTDVNVVNSKPFSAMTGAEKAKFIAKVAVFLVTFGFVFPNILVD